MTVYTTEITSDKITSHNPLHQRLLKAYYLAQPYIKGNVLEIGCGQGRGLDILAPNSTQYTALDKIQPVIDQLQPKYPHIDFICANIPPMYMSQDNQYDIVISFQVIEHIKDDDLFVKEIYRILKPGGKAIMTTPNIKKTLSRNPWHVREYNFEQISSLIGSIFSIADIKGIKGNEKVMKYYQMNKKSVNQITKFDIFNLQHRLPAAILKIPYEFFNRINRNRLKDSDHALVEEITHQDYSMTLHAEESFDFFCVMQKGRVPLDEGLLQIKRDSSLSIRGLSK